MSDWWSLAECIWPAASWILPLLGKLIDVVGKLGTVVIALMVWNMNRNQNARSNAATRRAAAVEDQKLRLALLERRVLAINAIDRITDRFAIEGAGHPKLVADAYKAMKAAELVFEDRHESEIRALMATFIRWNAIEQNRIRLNNVDLQRAAEMAERQYALEEQMIDALTEIRPRLREATKISAVPPLSW